MECCLCGVAEEDHRKRRKLHGHSCEVARTVLLNMSRFALSYSETKKTSAILCLACDKLLRYIMATEKKLELLRGKVTEKLERLQGSSSSLVRDRRHSYCGVVVSTQRVYVAVIYHVTYTWST